MKYEMVNNIDKGYFYLVKNNRGNHKIDYYLNKFNINLNEYHIMKGSGNFRFIDKEDIDKWASIIYFDKDIYNKEDIQKWLNFLYKDLKISLNFLNRPFPPKEIFNKIKIVEDGL